MGKEKNTLDIGSDWLQAALEHYFDVKKKMGSKEATAAPARINGAINALNTQLTGRETVGPDSLEKLDLSKKGRKSFNDAAENIHGDKVRRSAIVGLVHVLNAERYKVPDWLTDLTK